MLGVVTHPHADEAVQPTTELEQSVRVQRRPIANDIISEHEQPTKSLAEQPLPAARLRKSSRVDQFFQYCF